MTLPGIFTRTVVDRMSEAGGPREATGFIVGQTEKGQIGAVIWVYSFAEYVRRCGQRAGYATMYDAAETFFALGGRKLGVGRVVGAAPVKATIPLYDQTGSLSADIALQVTAKSVGAWANSLRAEAIAGDGGTDYRVKITHATDATINEISPSFSDRDSAVAWASASSEYVDIALGVSAENPRVQAAAALAGGTEDAGSIADAHFQNALNGLPKQLGPGQIAIPGNTTATRQQFLYTHAKATNRVAMIDLANVSSAATLKTAALACRAMTNSERGAVWASWYTIPGVSGGTTRTVPGSAVMMGLIARNDALTANPNQPAAGQYGTMDEFVISLAQPEFNDADAELLNDVGANIGRIRRGSLRNYAYRTVANPVTSPDWVSFNHVRTRMVIEDIADEVGERFAHLNLDGKRQEIGNFGGQLALALKPLYTVGALFGATEREAYSVDVGDTVNPVSELALNRLHARIGARYSPSAEQVFIDHVKIPITQEV